MRSPSYEDLPYHPSSYIIYIYVYCYVNMLPSFQHNSFITFRIICLMLMYTRMYAVVVLFGCESDYCKGRTCTDEELYALEFKPLSHVMQFIVYVLQEICEYLKVTHKVFGRTHGDIQLFSISLCVGLTIQTNAHTHTSIYGQIGQFY